MSNHTSKGKRTQDILDPIVNGKKICTTCGQLKQATTEFFRVDKSREIGLSRGCKGCLSKKAKEFRDRNLDRINDERKQKYKNNLEFRNKLLNQQREYRTNNRERHLKNKRRDYWKHRDKNVQRMRESRNNPDFVAKKREMDRAYGKRNRESLLLKQREWLVNNLDEYNRKRREKYRENPSKIKLINLKRESIKRNVKFDFTEEDELKARKYFENGCAVCGREVEDGFIIVMDHWKPLSKGGDSTKHNLIPLCHRRKGRSLENQSCNTSKNGRDPEQWLIWKFGEEKAEEVLSRINAYFNEVNQ